MWKSECTGRGNPTSTAKLQQLAERTGNVTERKDRARPETAEGNSG